MSVKGLFKLKTSFIIILFILSLLFMINGNGLCQQLSLDIKVGFMENYVPDNWVPISIVVSNKGDIISGEIVISTRKEDLINDQVKETEYIIPVNQPANSKKLYRKTVYYKMDYFSEIKIKLVSNGKILHEEEISLKRIYQNQKFLVVNDSFSGFGFLSDLAEKDRFVLYQEVEFLPADWLGYHGLDLIILGRADYTVLSVKQKEALLNWMKLGNTIIITGEGNYQTYNSDLFKEIFPADYIKKEEIEIHQVPARLWELRLKDYQVLEKTDNIALALGRNYAAGQVIFSLVDFQSPEIKGLYYEELISGVKQKQFLQAGFLDYLVEDMFNSVKFNFPEKYQIFLLLVIFILLISYLVYLYLYTGKIKLHFFLAIFFLVIAAYSGILYVSIYQAVIDKNATLSEVAIVNLLPDTNQAFVESYITFQDLKTKDIELTIESSQGSLANYSTSVVRDFNEEYSFYLKDNLVKTKPEGNSKKITTGFRSYYQAMLPLYFNGVRKENNLDISIINKSNFIVDALFIYYQGKWYSYKGLESKSTRNIQLSEDNYIGRAWYYWYVDQSHRNRLPDSVNFDIMNKTLSEMDIQMNKIIKNHEEEGIFVLGVLIDSDFNAILTDRPVNKEFVGIFNTYLDIKQ